VAAAEAEVARRRQLARQQRQARRQPFWKWARRFAGVLLLAGLTELIVAVLTAPTFKVRSVEIVGAQVTPRESIAAITDTLDAQNWVRVRTARAARELAALPAVQTARITRDFNWPPSLTAHITERRPFVRIGAGEAWWVVDENGVPFRRADKSDEGLYAVTSPKLAPRLGQPLSGPAWQRAAAITRALEGEKQSGWSWPLRRVYLDRDEFASLRLAGGAHDELLVRLGAAEWPEKLERARQALDYFDQTGRRAQVLNLVSYDRPAWTPASSFSSGQPDEEFGGDRAGDEQASAPDDLAKDREPARE
jgi:hypothetical protein